MRNIILYTLLCLFFTANVSFAQDNKKDDGFEIDWEKIEATLKPLEEIKLTPPQLTTGENGELQTWLYKGEVSPWDGVLLNPPAAAYIITEYEASRSRASAALEKQRNSDMNRLRFEIGKLELQLYSEREQHETQVTGLKNENKRLTEIHQKLIDEKSNNFWDNFAKIGGGVVGGLAVGVLVGFFTATSR